MGFRTAVGHSYRHDPHNIHTAFTIVGKPSPLASAAPTSSFGPYGDGIGHFAAVPSPPRSPTADMVPSLPAPPPSYMIRHVEAPYEYAMVPPDALHKNLQGAVSFVAYPQTPFALPPPYLPKSAMSRVFIGQLPYDVTDMQLQWLCYTFGNGAAVYFPERITRHSSENKGDKIPTGCVHAYVDPAQLDALFAGLNDRLLIDDPGVWVAESPAEKIVLERYCEALKCDRKHRASRRPHTSVVAQLAHSTFVPRPPSYRAFKKHQN